MVPADWALLPEAPEDSEESEESAEDAFAALEDFSASAGSAFSAEDCEAGFSAWAGFSAAGCPDLAAGPSIESFRPGWIRDGSAPTASRLSA